MKVTLTKVYRTTKSKDGKPLTTKQGKAYERVSIKTQEHGDKWLSGFGASWNEGWNEGDTINVNVEQAGQYLNFSKVDPMEDIEARLARLETAVFSDKSGPTDEDPIHIDNDDLPF